MIHRWHVVRDGKKIGEGTGEYIRQGLRDGMFDPFDQICRDGSSVMVNILEVDEIFEIQQAGSGENFVPPIKLENTPASDSEQPPPAQDNTLTDKEAKPKKQRKKDENKSSSSRRKKNAQEKDNAVWDQSSAHNEFSQIGRKTKIYFVYNKQGSRLGLLSSDEILSLYNKRIIEEKMMVVQKGAKPIPVKKFVNELKQNRSINMDPAKKGNKVSLANSKVLNQVIQGFKAEKIQIRLKKKLFFTLAAFACVVGLGWMGWHLNTTGQSLRSLMSGIRISPKSNYNGSGDFRALLKRNRGKVITIGPFRFNKNQLKGCSAQCAFTLNGNNGTSILAVADKKKLLRVSPKQLRGLYVTGKIVVKKNKYVIIVSRMR